MAQNPLFGSPPQATADDFTSVRPTVRAPLRTPTANDVVRRATELGVDPDLALSIWSQESSSGRNPSTSTKGARGGFQVMPGTYRQMMGSEDGQDDQFNNMEAGLRYLKHGQTTLGTKDPELLAAGYHAGYGHPDLKAGRIPSTNDGSITTAAYARSVAGRAGKPQGLTADDFADAPPTAKPGAMALTPDDFTDTPPEKPATRTWGEVAGDTGVQLAEGVNTMLGAIPSLIAPEGSVAGFFDDNAKAWREKQSASLQQRMDTANKAIDVAGNDGVVAQIVEASKQYFSDPGLAARFVTTNLPSMIPGIGAAKVAQAAALARGATVAKAAGTATTAAAGVNAVMNAGGARGEAFQDIKRTLMAQGKSEPEAEAMALADSRVVAAVGGVAGAVSGKTGIEKVLVQGATKAAPRNAAVAGLKAFGIEAAGEQGEEVAPKIATNLQAGKYDNRPALKDVGQTIVETGIGSGPGAIVSGGKEVLDQRRANALATGQPAPAPVPNIQAAPEQQAAPAAPAPASGPLERATATAAGVTQAMPVQIVGDDGVTYNAVTGPDGSISITPVEQKDPGTPLTNALASAADKHADNPIATPEQPATPEQAPVAAPAAEAPKPPNLKEMDEPALRERLKYIADQAKSNGGWSQMLVKERRKVEREINARVKSAEVAATPEANQNSGFIDGQDGYRIRVDQHKKGSNLLDPTADIGAFTYEVRKGSDDTNPLTMVVTKDGKLVPASSVLINNQSNGTAWVPPNKTVADTVRAMLEQRAKTKIGSAERKAIDAKIADAVKGSASQPATAAQPELPTQPTGEINGTQADQAQQAEAKQPEAQAPAVKSAQDVAEPVAKVTAKPVNQLTDDEWAVLIGAVEGPARADGPNDEISIDDQKLLKKMVVKAIKDGVSAGKSREQIVARIEGLTKGGIGNAAMSRINDLLEAQHSAKAAPDQTPAPTGSDAADKPLPPTDIKMGDKVLIDGKPHTVTQGVEGGIAAESDAEDIGNGVKNSQVRILKGDDAIRAKIAADESGLNAKPSKTGKKVGPASLGSAKADLDHLFGVDTKRAKAIERIAAGKAWFNDGVKAKDFITKNGLKDTHRAVQGNGGRWDIVAKPESQEIVTKHRVIDADGKPATLKIIRNKSDPAKVVAVSIHTDGEKLPASFGAEGVVTDEQVIKRFTDTEIINGNNNDTSGKPASAEEVVQKADAQPEQAATVQPDAGKEEVAPTASPEQKDALTDKERAAKAKMLAAVGKLAALASKNTRANWTPEEEQQLLPIMIELFDGAMELGQVKFKQAVNYVRDFIGQNIDRETADSIPFDTLQGAYIATAGRHKDKPVTPKKEVAGFETMEELQASNDQSEEPKAQEKANDTTGNDADYVEPLDNELPKGNPELAQDVASEAGESVRDPDTNGDGRANRSGSKRRTGVGRGEKPVLHGPTAEVRPLDNGPLNRKDDSPNQLPLGGIGNFQITDEDKIGEGTKGEKLRNNMAAIRTLRQIQKEDRAATPAEQATMAKFVGWGGLRELIDPNTTGKQWIEARAELLGTNGKAPLLVNGDKGEDWIALQRSTTAAHYTAPEIVKAMWGAVSHFGFTGGRALEPTSGIGNFIGLQPPNLAASTEWHGAELDTITGQLAKLIYPEAAIHAGTGFESVPFAKGAFDLAIGNPPFGSLTIKSDVPAYAHIPQMKIHNYIIAKTGEHLRPGGVMAMVVTHRFLDTANPEARDHLAKSFKFLGAFRLPNDAFKANAGTDVVTDVLFLQKLREGEKATDTAWLDTDGKITVDGVEMRVNRYYQANPENILGRSAMDGTMYAGRGEGEYTVHGDGRDLTKAISDLVANKWADLKDVAKPTNADQDVAAVMIKQSDMPIGGVMLDEAGKILKRDMDDEAGNAVIKEVTPETLWKDGAEQWQDVERAAKALRDGKDFKAAATEFVEATAIAYTAKGEKRPKPTKAEQAVYDIRDSLDAPAYQWSHNEQLKEITASLQRKKLGEDGYQSLKGLLGLRNTALRLIAAEMQSAPSMESLRTQLNAEYDAYVAKHGYVSDPANANLLDGDVGVESGLETGFKPKNGKAKASAGKSDIFRQRVNFPYKEITSAKNAHDGLQISMSERGKLDIEYIAKLTKKSKVEVINELSSGESPSIFFDPDTNEYTDADNYLSGNVKRKLEIARTNGLKENIKALEAVQPEPKTRDNVKPSIRGSWMPESVFEQFLTDIGVQKPRVNIIASQGMILANGGALRETEFGAQFKSGIKTVTDIFNSAASGKSITIWVESSDGKRVKNEAATKEVNLLAERMTKVFEEWAYANDDRMNAIVDAFNEKMNTHIPRKYDGNKYLKTVGASPSIVLRTTQKNAAWRMIQDDGVLLDHVVGAGKTFTIVTAVKERKRLGLSRKPMIVVPNHLVTQWAKEFYVMYPGAKILAATPDDFSLKNRRRMFSRIATGDYDAVIIGHSSLGFIPAPMEDQQRIVNENITELQDVLNEMKAKKESGRTVTQIQEKLQKYQFKLKELMDAKKDEIGIDLESMGIDYLAVDEMHEFKNLEYSSAGEHVVGMNDPNGSKKAFDLYIKIRGIQSRGGAVAGATGTPVSNSLVELYTMMKYLAFKDLTERNQANFDAWSGAYARTENKLEYTATQKLKPRRVLAGLNNLSALKQIYESFADVISMDDLKRMYSDDVKAKNKMLGTNERTEFPVPKVEGGKRQLDAGPITSAQSQYMDYLVARMNAIEQNKSNKEYAKIDNPLHVLTDARKMSLDIRIVDPTAPRDENGKVARAAERIKTIYDKWDADKGAQMVFCDLSTPAKTALKNAKAFVRNSLDKIVGPTEAKRIRARVEAQGTFVQQWRYIESLAEDIMENPQTNPEVADKIAAYLGGLEDVEATMTTADVGFSVYDDLRQLLTEKGIPEREIAFIHDYNTPEQKAKLFQAVNDGEIRVLLGSSAKMGAGTNAQKRLVGLHHMDAPWRPSDVEQREGRIIRQGNMLYQRDPDGFTVSITAYSTNGTSDAVMWQVLERKSKAIEEFRKTDMDSTDENEGDANQYAEFMAQSTGNPVFKLKLEAEREVDLLDAETRGVVLAKSQAKNFMENYARDMAAAESLIKFAKDANADSVTVGKESGTAQDFKAAMAAADAKYTEEYAKYLEKKEDAGKALDAWSAMLEMERGEKPKMPTSPAKPGPMSKQVLDASGYARAIKAALEKGSILGNYEFKVGNIDLRIRKSIVHETHWILEIGTGATWRTYETADAAAAENSAKLAMALSPDALMQAITTLGKSGEWTKSNLESQRDAKAKLASRDIGTEKLERAKKVADWYKAQVSFAEQQADEVRGRRVNTYIASDRKRDLKQFSSQPKDPKPVEFEGETYNLTGYGAPGLAQALDKNGNEVLVASKSDKDGWKVESIIRKPAGVTYSGIKKVDDAAFAAKDKTDTPEFRRWFGGSKVVDEDGKPLVVYHGTNNKFTVFDRSSPPSPNSLNDGYYGNGFYASAEDWRAEDFGANVMPLYMSIQRPFMIDGFDPINAAKSILKLNGLDQDQARKLKEIANGDFGEDLFLTANALSYALNKNAAMGDVIDFGVKLTKILEQNGYDGVIADNADASELTEYVAFRPEQIKSATGNNGNFDPSNADIRFNAGWDKIEATTKPLPALTDAQSKADIDLLTRKLDGHNGLPAEKDKPFQAVRLPDAEDLAAIGEAFGVRPVGFDLKPGAPSAYDFFNGVTFKLSGKAVFLGARSNRPHLALLGHETAHQLRGQRPDLYNKLADAVAKYVDEAKYERDFVSSPIAVNVKTADGKQEEFMGEVLSDAFMEPTFWRTLYKESPKAFKNVYNIVLRLLQKLAGTVYGKKSAPYLTDYNRVMEIAGEVLAELGNTPAAPQSGLFASSFAEKSPSNVEVSFDQDEDGTIYSATAYIPGDGNAFVSAEANNDGTYSITESGMPKNMRGQGNGVALYDGLLRKLFEIGAPAVTSDNSVSADARKIYEALSRRGYVVQRNQNAALDTDGILNASKPVFTVTAASTRPGPSKTETESFKKWFGDSKVVDAEGKPLVVYHGSPSPEAIGEFIAQNGGIYFISDRKAAEDYTAQRGMWRGPKTGAITEAFVSLKNPLVIDALGKRNDNIPVPWKDWKPKVFGNLPPGAVSVQAAAEYAKANGHDGLIVRNVVDTADINDKRKSDVFVAFESNQVKSATGNNGNFDSTNSDIRFAVKDPEPEGLTPPDQGLLRRIQAAVQNNMNRVREVQDRIEKRIGRKLPEYADYYGAETNRPGRVASRMEDSRNKLIEPLMAELAKSGHTLGQLDELLHAQHAEERNIKVAEINPAFPDGGSGMTTAEANAILEKYRNDRALQDLATKARRIARDTLDMKLAYGLIDQETHEILTEAYKSYVPLKGTGEYGPKIKKAMGHGERDEHILENLKRDYELAVVAGERNLARQSLLKMVLQNPDSELWTVGMPPKGRYVAGQSFDVYKSGKKVNTFDSAAQAQAWIDGRTDGSATYTIQTDRRKFVVERDGVAVKDFYSYSKAEDYIASIKDPIGKLKIVDAGETVREFVKPLQDNEVIVYVDGQPVRIQIHDEKLARQLRPLNQGQMHPILEGMRSVNRYLSHIYTGYNPAFILRNAARDTMTGTLNITGNQGATMAAKAWSHYPAAVKALAQWASTGNIPENETGKMLREYRDNGGKVGASWMGDLEEQGKSLQRMFDDAYGASKFLADGRVGKAAFIAGRKIVGGMAHVVEIGNQATENGLRLALFISLRKQGASTGQAAQAAKAVTVDFDRKGSMTGALGAIYLFFNPAVQGTANALKTLAKGDHKEQAWAALGMLALLGLYAAGKGMDEDKDRWLGEGWETRSKNLMLDIGGKHIKVPVSQEYAPFFAFGTAMAEAMRGESTMAAAGRMVSSFIDAYFPLQGAFSYDSDNHGADAMGAAIPTILKPEYQIATNRNGFGTQIVPENEFTKDKIDNQKMYRGTKNTVYDAAAQGIAKAGELAGAGRYENDITKVSPETLKMLWRTYTGGLGAFVTDTVGVASMASHGPGQVETSDMPIVKDFLKDNDVKAIRGRFYDLAKEAKNAAAEFGQAKKAGDDAAIESIMASPKKAELLGLDRLVKKTAQAAAKIRDQETEINADTSLKPSEKRAKLKELENAEEDLYRAAIGAFK